MAQVQKLEGVERVTIARESWTLAVRYDPARVDVARIQAVIDAAADAADALR